MTGISAGSVTKHPTDRVWLVFDYGNLPEIAAGESITGQTIAPVTGLTISGVSLVAPGYEVGAWYSGGTDGVNYTVTCRVTLSGGAEIAREGTLRVRSTE